jgi:hypothetical protein
MKPLTTSVYTFSKIVEGGFLYVDKTAAIHELLRPAFGQYFLSRPRRFGKSLLVSTLKAIFQGRRELFTGLALDSSDYDWKPYPVIHLDLGTCQADSVAELKRKLNYLLDDQSRQIGVTLTREGDAPRFQELVVKLAEREGKVVILVDEYDKPLLGQLGQPGVREIQNCLKAFYGVIKTTEAYQRFVLVTGVSKFTRVSIFSDLNNLTDLTMNRETATLLGYTQSELEENFSGYIDALAVAQDRSREQTITDLREWYNGYRFEEMAETVYNPVSVMKCFQERKFKNYWFETGTPSFLIELLRDKPVNLDKLVVPETTFSAWEPDKLEALPLLVQTGYMTIKSVKRQGQTLNFHLGFPNQEVLQSFSYWLARDFTSVPAEDLTGALNRMLASLERGNVSAMLEDLKTFFAQVPYTINLAHEKYYQTIFFTVFTLIGAMTEAEVATNIGRMDAVVKTATDIFLFEFKLHESAESALAQIRTVHYAERYRDDGRRVTLVGVSFDEKARNLGRWLVESA